MDLGIRGRVAAVAAASSGLGRAVALELAREGASVMICSRSAERVAEAVRAVREQVRAATGAEARVEGTAVDLASSDGPEQFVARVREELGPVDILVANNGGPPPGPPLGLGDRAWREAFELTFESSRKLVEAAVPDMRRRRWGRIVFITSVSVKQPIAGLTTSTAMRSAVVGFAKALADALAAEGITVNTAAPGSTATERLRALFAARAREQDLALEEVEAAARRQIPMGRFGRPDEFAAAVAFLCSERASYITGTVLPVDGGVVRSLT
jgi:3-oxoacyl-[acyl-carrier protein] reductase